MKSRQTSARSYDCNDAGQCWLWNKVISTAVGAEPESSRLANAASEYWCQGFVVVDRPVMDEAFARPDRAK